MNAQNKSIKQNFKYCIAEQIEDDNGFEPGYYATKYSAELIEIFRQLLEEYPEAIDDEMIQKKHLREIKALENIDDPLKEVDCYHYSEAKKIKGYGRVDRIGIRIDYYDQVYFDPNMFMIQITKVFDFIHINCMDKVEGLFHFHRDTGEIKPVLLEYYHGDESGNYRVTKMPKVYLEQLTEFIELDCRKK